MSKAISSTKKIPLCLSMGVTEVLEGRERIIDKDLLDNFSFQDRTAFLTETKNFVLVCGNKSKPNDFEPNHFVISFGVRRALAMKNYTRLPVIIVTNNRFETSMFIEQFNKLNSCFRLYVSNETQRKKVDKEIKADYPNEADFILTTYNTFWGLTTNKNDPSSVQIILINPLRRKHINEDVGKLDVIFGCVHRHKRIRPNYSFILDEAQFPILSRKDYQFFFKADSSFFFRCDERIRLEYNNPFREAIPHLYKDQFQLFIFTELFRGRKLIKELVKEFKTTFTYKLYLYSNGVFPSSEEELPSDELLKEKNRLDQKVFGGIVKHIHSFTKGQNTKTITGEITYRGFDFNVDLSKQDLSRTYSWDKPKESARFLPVVTKEKGRFKLSTLGEAIFSVSSWFGGVEGNFSELLAHFSRILYKNKKESHKFSVNEIIIFYLQLIGSSYQTVKRFEEAIPEKLDTEKKNDQMIEIIERKFNPIIKNYKRISAKKVLGAFEKLMNTEAYIFYQQFKNYNKEEKCTIEERRIEWILRRANRETLTVKFTGDYYHMFWQEAKKVLEGLVEEGRLVRIITYTNRGESKLKYLTQELLDANPHLQKNCGNCQWYNKRFKTCTFLRLQQAKNPSTLDSDDIEYANGTIRFELTACGKYKEKEDYESDGDNVRYTTTADELTQDMKDIPISFLSGNVSEYEYHCLSCQEQIKEFGTLDRIFFPRRRVICTNCSTIYLLLKDKKKVRVKMEQRHHQRSLYYKETATVPDVLKKKDPSYVYVIHDVESSRIKINEASDEPPYYLVIGKYEIALDKVQFVYFSGIRHQELEGTLRLLADFEPEKYKYEIVRTEQKSKKKKAKSRYKKTFSAEDYFYIEKIIKKSSDYEIFNHQFLVARHLSNIAGLLSIKYEIELKSFSDWSYNHQLLGMVDLHMKVIGGEVKSSYYGTQLEALSNKHFFDLLKAEAARVGLWTKGRVNSRLVIDMFLSFSNKVSSAFSPLDALLNQMLRSFRAEVDQLFHKMGMDPALLGPGLFHRRKTKSDIDKLGFYFDLIEAVRVLVLVTMVKAIRDGTLGFNDCKYVLGEDGQEIYQVKGSSLDKFTNLVSEALEQSVSHNGQIMTFQRAFEFNLLCLRVAFEKCLSEIDMHKQITLKKIKKCFDESHFIPFTFCPAELEEKLLALNHFASEGGVIFEGIEQEVLERKRARENYRAETMNHWYKKEVIEQSNVFRLTKHQIKEQDRSLIVILLLLYNAHEIDFTIVEYSTCNLGELLGLTQNQIQRILDQMVSRSLLLRDKKDKKNLYQLNLENQNVKELRFALGVTLTRDEIFTRELIIDIPPHLDKVSSIISQFRMFFDSFQKNFHNNYWLNWEPTTIIRRVIDWVEEKAATSRKYFKMIGDIHGKKQIQF